MAFCQLCGCVCHLRNALDHVNLPSRRAVVPVLLAVLVFAGTQVHRIKNSDPAPPSCCTKLLCFFLEPLSRIVAIFAECLIQILTAIINLIKNLSSGLCEIPQPPAPAENLDKDKEPKTDSKSTPPCEECFTSKKSLASSKSADKGKKSESNKSLVRGEDPPKKDPVSQDPSQDHAPPAASETPKSERKFKMFGQKKHSSPPDNTACPSCKNKGVVCSSDCPNANPNKK